MTDSFLEYAKLHLISLEQDLESALKGEGYEFLEGQIFATTHLLTAYADLLYNGNLGKGE
jgi:hypothetical protein